MNRLLLLTAVAVAMAGCAKDEPMSASLPREASAQTALAADPAGIPELWKVGIPSIAGATLDVNGAVSEKKGETVLSLHVTASPVDVINFYKSSVEATSAIGNHTLAMLEGKTKQGHSIKIVAAKEAKDTSIVITIGDKPKS